MIAVYLGACQIYRLVPSKLTVTGNGITWEAGDQPRKYPYHQMQHCAISSQAFGETTVSVLAIALEGAKEPVLFGVAPETPLGELERVLREHGVDVKREAQTSRDVNGDRA